jgi:hypothetical protein
MHAHATGVIQVMPGAHATSTTAYVKHREGELVLQSTCYGRLSFPGTEFAVISHGRDGATLGRDSRGWVRN